MQRHWCGVGASGPGFRSLDRSHIAIFGEYNDSAECGDVGISHDNHDVCVSGASWGPSHLPACGKSGVVTMLPYGEQIPSNPLSFLSDHSTPCSLVSLLNLPRAEITNASSISRGCLSWGTGLAEPGVELDIASDVSRLFVSW